MTDREESSLVHSAFGFITDSTVEDMEYAIQNNLDIAKELEYNNPIKLIIARTLKSLYKDELIAVTPSYVLETIREKRPDLYKVITKDEKSFKWFVWNIRNIKDLVLKK